MAQDIDLQKHIAQAAQVLCDFLDGVQPVCGLILGSGLNFYADALHHARILPYNEVPFMRVSTAEGHKGQFVIGYLDTGATIPVLCMQGRIHGYEGASAVEVAFPVWVMHAAGIDTLITTNAAGAINRTYSVGSFCCMKDHINFTGRNPLVGVEQSHMAQRFVPMLDAYDSALRVALLELASHLNIEVHEGVYLGLLGPSFETPAEIKMFSLWGADTVAMSVVEEVIAARHVGMRVVGLSFISNMACGIEGADPNSDEVMDAALQAETDFKTLMNAFITTCIQA